MSADTRFGYGQARIQAGLERLPTESEWGHLAAVRTLASFLEEARTGPLKPWVKGFSAQSRASDLERGVRVLARERILQVAAWSPERWRDAVSWLEWLAWLPVVEHLARGEPAPDWLDDEPLWSMLAEAAGPLLSVGDDEAVGARWLAGWIERWPPMGREARAHLEGLIRLTGQHLDTFRSTRPELAWEPRQRLRGRLNVYPRRYPLEPVGVFAYLGLVLLDLERLRAELLRRALFGLESVD